MPVGFGFGIEQGAPELLSGELAAGGQGRDNVRALFQEADAQIIAVADPIQEENMDAFYFKGLAGRGPVKAEIEKHYAAWTPNFTCAAYEDFRVMLEKERAIDAVLCATPDHLHAYVSVFAMRAGQRVYWDAANLKARNLPQADALIHGTGRSSKCER